MKEELFHAIAESVRDYAIFLLDTDGLVRTWNKGAERIMQYAAEEIRGRHFSKFYSPEDLGIEQPSIDLDAALKNGKYEGQGWRMRKDGSRFWANVVMTAMKEEDGTVFGFSKMVQDVMERKGEEKFKRVVESAPNAIVMVNERGIITLINGQTEKLFGYRREELLGKSVELLVPKRFRVDHSKYRSGFAGDPQTRPMGAGRDLFGVRKDGSEVQIEIGLNPIRTDEGLAVLASVVDITERKQAEQKIMEEKKRLERANLELDSFVYIASHDLRAPLRHISSFASIVNEKYKDQLDEDGKDCLSEILKAAHKMNTLILDLLTLSRVSRMENPYQIVKLRALIDAAVDRLEKDIDQTHAIVDIGEDLPEIFCDPVKMTEAFVNLIGNAIKFSSKGGQIPIIKIGYDDGADQHEIFVQDNGIGIDPAYHADIFNMFKRLHSQDEYEGTGLGLYIVKKIMEDHGGQVKISSELGKGSKFTLCIPKKISRNEKQEAELRR